MEKGNCSLKPEGERKQKNVLHLSENKISIKVGFRSNLLFFAILESSKILFYNGHDSPVGFQKLEPRISFLKAD